MPTGLAQALGFAPARKATRERHRRKERSAGGAKCAQEREIQPRLVSKSERPHLAMSRAIFSLEACGPPRLWEMRISPFVGEYKLWARERRRTVFASAPSGSLGSLNYARFLAFFACVWSGLITDIEDVSLVIKGQERYSSTHSVRDVDRYYG